LIRKAAVAVHAGISWLFFISREMVKHMRRCREVMTLFADKRRRASMGRGNLSMRGRRWTRVTCEFPDQGYRVGKGPKAHGAEQIENLLKKRVP